MDGLSDNEDLNNVFSFLQCEDPPCGQLEARPTPARRGHAHRRSGAISNHDLSTILRPSNDTKVSHLTGLLRSRTDILLEAHKSRSLEHILTAELPSIGTIYLKFGDLGEAEAAYCAAKAHRPFWSIRYISPKHFASELQPGSSK